MKTKKIAGLLLILLSVTIVLVSAFVYSQDSQTTTQTITDVATLSITNAVLGNIEEGETILYTPTNTSALDQILTVTTGKANVYLHIDTDLDILTNYVNFTIEVLVDTQPGSSLSDPVAVLTMASPDTSAGIDLDTAGSYKFDFRITTTADLVSSNSDEEVNIAVSAESTST